MKLIKVTENGALWGYMWECPGCGENHCVPTTGPRAWGFNGNEEKPTFTPSVLVHSAGRLGDDGKRFETPRCHFFVRNGRIEFCGDSQHALAGKTVDMLEVPR